MSRYEMINQFGDIGLNNLITTCTMIDWKLRWGEMRFDMQDQNGAIRYRVTVYPTAQNHMRVTELRENTNGSSLEIDILSSYKHTHKGIFDSLICLVGID